MKQLRCLICNLVHNFKMTKSGFIVSNDKFIKIKDEEGVVNFVGQNVMFRE